MIFTWVLIDCGVGMLAVCDCLRCFCGLDDWIAGYCCGVWG